MTDPASRTASPWVINTRAIGLSKHAGPGLSAPLAITAAPPDRTESAVLQIPADSRVTVDGLLESVSEGVLASGTASATAVGSCSRCLREVAIPLAVPFRELYAYPDSATAETTDEDEVPRVIDETIDLGGLVHDELVLAMPTVPVCAEDCQGLCPECGELMDSVGPDHRHETIDPRWAALAGLVDSGAGTHPARGTAPADADDDHGHRSAGGDHSPTTHADSAAGETKEK